MGKQCALCLVWLESGDRDRSELVQHGFNRESNARHDVLGQSCGVFAQMYHVATSALVIVLLVRYNLTLPRVCWMVVLPP